jgi:hypothetical protein
LHDFLFVFRLHDFLFVLRVLVFLFNSFSFSFKSLVLV